MRKGESIFLRNDGRYEARYIKKYDDKGKAIYGSVYAKTYNECKRKRNEVLLNLKEKPIKLSKETSKEPFKNLLYTWLESKKGLIKETSYSKYYYLIEKHIIPDIGKVKKHKLTTDFLNNYLTKKLNSGRLDEQGGLSNNTVYDIALIIKQVCRKYNIQVSLISIPKTVGKGKNFYDDEKEKLQKGLTKIDSLDCVGILLSLLLGLRRGEVCGLRWKDIDIDNKIIHINRIISRVKNFDSGNNKTKLIITKPKTDSSIRELPIPDKLINLLKNAKKGASESSYILTNKDKYMDPRTYYNHYKKVLVSLSVNDHSYHDLRHTFASSCIELGMDAKTLMELLGHANISTTLSVYVHSSMNNKRNFINKL